MSAFWDVNCQHCGKRFGWQGLASDRPPCPKCGAQERVPLRDLQQLAEFRALMQVGKDAIGSKELAAMRRFSGLSPGQLAGKLGVAKSTVDNVEAGKSKLREDKRRAWIQVCGFGDAEPEGVGA